MGFFYTLVMEDLLQVHIGFIDSYFVSKLGDRSITGVGVTNLLMT